MRRILALLHAAIWPCGALALAVADAKRSGGCNALFITTDEQHHRSLSLTGNPHITTPNMDRIGREGALTTKSSAS